MNNQTKRIIWDPKTDIPRVMMNKRIKNMASQRAWEEAARVMIKKNILLNKLRVAEVGCGSGTTALTFGLIGAAVTLIDFNSKALEMAGGIYRMYGVSPELINADCLQGPADNIRGSFDLVVSSGLMEHFSGDLRGRCLAYHKDLLRPGGFVFITVPNCYCPWYEFVRLFRILTKTWKIDIEIPFSTRELNFIAEKTGFKSHYVIPNGDWPGDLKYYGRGFVSAIGDILPGSMRDTIKKWKSRRVAEKKEDQESAEEVRSYLLRRLSEIGRLSGARPENAGLINRLNSDLALFAFKD